MTLITNVQYILSNYKKEINIYFVVLVLIGLPSAILLNEYISFFLNHKFINFIYIFRFFIILFTIIICFNNKTKFNKYVFFIFLINIIFFYNQIFKNEINFNINFFDYMKSIQSIDENTNIFFLQKTKNLLISFFNVILVLLVLSFKEFKIEENKLIIIFYKILKILFSLIIIYLFIAILFRFNVETLKLKVFEDSSYFFPINSHLLSFIISLYTIAVWHKYLAKKKSKFLLFKIILAYFILLLTGENLHLFMSFFFKIVLLLFYKKTNKTLDKNFIIHATFFILIIIFYIYTNSKFNDNTATILTAISIRISIIKFYYMHIVDFNYFTGNNIFSKTNIIYPHNFIIDIYVCSGYFGVFLLIAIFNKIYNKFKNILKMKLLNIFFFYNVAFSFFSGFFFINIALNISLAFLLMQEKDNEV